MASNISVLRDTIAYVAHLIFLSDACYPVVVWLVVVVVVVVVKSWNKIVQWNIIFCPTGVHENMGVLQWSIIEPLLFVIYMNDLSSLSEPIIFADDTSVIIKKLMICV
jgi:hypothetical protein